MPTVIKYRGLDFIEDPNVPGDIKSPLSEAGGELVHNNIFLLSRHTHLQKVAEDETLLIDDDEALIVSDSIKVDGEIIIEGNGHLRVF